MRRRSGLILLAAAFLVAGCGGGSGDATAPSTPAQLAADRAVARGAVLRRDDFPSGYSARPHRASGPRLPGAVEHALLACSGLPKRFVDRSGSDQPYADSPDFVDGRFGSGPANEIESRVELYRSADDLRAPLARLAAPGAARCFEPFFRLAFAQGWGSHAGMTVTHLRVQTLSIGSIGDQSAALQGRITLQTPGGPVEQDLDLYWVRTGRALASMLAAGHDTPFDQRLAQSLLSTIAARMDDAR